jgi:hypothetical protein
MNWKTIQNTNYPTLIGLAYFGIGALAGGLVAGIGAGVGAKAMGSSFGAGFVGGATTIGFTAGFASGAAGGFTSVFITGAGNSWIQGTDVATSGYDFTTYNKCSYHSMATPHYNTEMDA